jgi:transglutaminase-like putative cysteine protease
MPTTTYRVTHNTVYSYNRPVSLCHNLAHLKPRDYSRQHCLSSELQVTPSPTVADDQVDYFGNAATFFTVQEPHQKLTIRSVSLVEVSPFTLPDPAGTPARDSVRRHLEISRDAESVEAYQYVFDSPYIRCSPELAEYARPSFPVRRPLLEAVLDLTRRIHADFRYDTWATTVATPILEVLEIRRGVCQDFAHLQIGCLRSCGLAARYVSGYLLTYPAAGQERLQGADASHAWVSVYCPGFGWIDMDPTNNLAPSDEHIVLAWGRDYDDVSPVKGVNLGGGRHWVSVGVDVVSVNDGKA